MPSIRFRRLAILLTVGCVAFGLPACSDDEPSGPGGNQDPYVGTWNATSFTAMGTDFIAAGMALQATITTTTYSLMVTDDMVGICDEAGTPDCTVNGPLSATATQITIDEGEEDPATFDFTITGNTMTWSGTIDGTAITITFSRVT